MHPALFPLVFLVLGFLFLGLLLIWRGAWPPRRGHVPYCRKCDYNLTALQSDRCPECGSPMTSELVVHGRRHRRPGLIVLGCLFLLPSLLFVAGSLTKVDWYRLKPAGWVLDDLQSTSPSVPMKAWRELDRRIQAGKLSLHHQSSLIDASLTEQGRPATAAPNSRLSGYLVAHLGDTYLDGLMSDAQVATFFEQICELELKVRPRIALGDPVPCRVYMRSRCPPAPFWVYVTHGPCRVDGLRPWGIAASGSSSLGSGGSGSHGWSIICSDLGTHALTTTLTVQVYSGPVSDRQAGTLHHEREVELHKMFEVLTTEPVDAVKMVSDPGLGAELRACMEPRAFSYSSYQAGRITGQIVVQALPTNVAFDIIARMDGEEISVGTLLRRHGEGRIEWCLNWPYDGAKIESFDLILRSSESLVRGSVDMYDAWDGELVYEDVPIAPDPSAREE